MDNILFSPPDITEEEIEEVAEALRSGWITTGPRTKELEKRLRGYCGADGCVCLNSATAAMELTLRLLGVGEGDEVITTSYTYTATCSVICHVGATPVLVDTGKDSYEIDYDAIEAAITEKTKVIMPVDIAGIMCDYDRIKEVLEKKKSLYKPENDMQAMYDRVVILADSAHGLGASYKGQKSGSVADFTAFSFHAVKNLTTAEGGAITWKLPSFTEDTNEHIYKQYQLMSLHGQSKDALAKTKLGGWEYDIVAPLYKCNMTDIMAAIGLVQLSRYESLLERRKEITDRYDIGFASITDKKIKVLSHEDDMRIGSRHLYLVRIEDADREYCNCVIEEMAKRGIPLNVHYKPLPMLTAYKDMGYDINNYPNAFNQFCNEITFPLHTKLTNEQIEYIIDNFKEVLENISKEL